MSTVPVQISADQLFRAVEQMAPTEFDGFVTRILTLRAERETPHLSRDESELLVKINRPIPEELQTRYDGLVAKRRTESLAPEEHAELLNLTDSVERAEAERVAALTALAQSRGVSLPDLMQSLGIEPPPYA
jgi:hypothetical protein